VTAKRLRIRLTPTDIALLIKIAPERMESYPRLRASVLAPVSRAHSWVILKRLVRHRFLTEIRGDGGGILGWSLTPKAKRLPEIEPHLPDTPERAPVYKTSFHHDRVVREVRGVLEKAKAVQSWISDHELKREFAHRMLSKGKPVSGARGLAIPDGIFEIVSQGEISRGALEVEITQKSKARIYRKLESHCASEDFDFTFFVMRDEKLRDLFCELLAEVWRKSWRVKSLRQQNGIYFTTLAEFRARGLHAIFRAEGDELTFAELAA
jgi:hypothetical protein